MNLFTLGPPINQLKTNQWIGPGESLTSQNKCFRLNLTRNGIIILYRISDGLVLWRSGFKNTGLNLSNHFWKNDFQKPR